MSLGHVAKQGCSRACAQHKGRLAGPRTSPAAVTSGSAPLPVRVTDLLTGRRPVVGGQNPHLACGVLTVTLWEPWSCRLAL